jgi:hypothetical protein
MSVMTVSITTMKRLCVMSGNKCAFPDCQNPIYTEDGILVGQMCHIEARSQGGKRYNPAQTDAERDGFENLLFMCGIHLD